ncbi:glycosyltransferase family 2 protein [Paraglaciecola arctica]|uniref:glycosyltransferase family 2 protein n=1 Tax=Paraglaciecola arctica TaxID=1128911 RepID=UPI001C06CC89|nr:glycosyltransferase family 2 protein [Paraglaciecola arctica]MBU3005735.1 glycosyltransferase [Paraglaciecola arctica]
MFTIIIPTYNHEDTIKLAIQSALQQTYQSFEIFVVGDGASARTKTIVEELSVKDPRITYFDNVKGAGNGEFHRHNAIKRASGDYIAYLGDDDIWLPNHLETLLPYLENYDFVHSAQATVLKENKWHVYAGDLNHPTIRRRMLTERFNFFGPTTVVHRLNSYLALPYGWRAKPAKMSSDLFMWRQWLTEKAVKFKSINQVTILHLASPSRLEMSIEERCFEMKTWLNEINANTSHFNQFAQSQLLDSWNKQISDKIHPNSSVSVIIKKLYHSLFS